MALGSSEVPTMTLSEGVRLASAVMRRGQTALVEEIGDNAEKSRYFQWPRMISTAFRLPEGILVVTDPVDAKEILVADHDIIEKGTRDFRIIREFLGNSLVPVQGGTEWWNRRRLLMPTFSHTRVKPFGENIVKEAKQSLTCWTDPSHERPLHPEMTHLTLQVITNFMFGETLPEETIREIGTHVTTLAEYTSRRVSHMGLPPSWLPTRTTRTFRHALKSLHSIMGELYDRRIQSPDKYDDMLKVLIDARDEATGTPLSRKDVLNEALSMLIAGHETTANTITWAFYLLSKHPKIQEEIRLQIREVVGDREPSVDDLHKLSLIDWVAKEAMRLYPPVWVFSRKNRETITLADGRVIPPKTFIAFVPWLIHRQPEYWKDPDQFNPYRFDPKNPDPGVSSSFIPFGIGQRRCLGADLAFTEVGLVLATFLQRHSVVISEDVEPALLITTRPSSPVFARFVEVTQD